MNMKQKITSLVSKSERGLSAARKHVAAGDYDFAVSRAYYAMFHIAEGLLLTKNLSASKHGGLLSLFSEHFVKTGLVEKGLHQDLHRAFELRQKGDYWSESIVTRETAEDLCRKAESFVAKLKGLLDL